MNRGDSVLSDSHFGYYPIDRSLLNKEVTFQGSQTIPSFEKPTVVRYKEGEIGNQERMSDSLDLIRQMRKKP